jgi:hypothetical protein
VAKHSPNNQQSPRKSGRGGPRPNSGGKRPGAGRPKKAVTLAKESAREVVVRRITDRVDELLDNLFRLAKAGDRESSVYLLNRLLGKPTDLPADLVRGEGDYDVDLGPKADDPPHDADPPAAGLLG